MYKNINYLIFQHENSCFSGNLQHDLRKVHLHVPDPSLETFPRCWFQQLSFSTYYIPNQRKAIFLGSAWIPYLRIFLISIRHQSEFAFLALWLVCRISGIILCIHLRAKAKWWHIIQGVSHDWPLHLWIFLVYVVKLAKA